MKFLESHFEEYIKTLENDPLINNNSNLKHIDDMNNIIIYGPPGTGKYSQMLKIIKPLSSSELKYEKKITIISNKNNYTFKISDIHYEIDMSLLGCNSKILWHDIFTNIIDIISASNSKSGIIVCKYFNDIHIELLEIFYSYMQIPYNSKITVKFILITTDISFIPCNIINCCKKITISRPARSIYNKCLKIKLDKNTDVSNITNIKDLIKLKDYQEQNKDISSIQQPFKIVCNQIVETIINYNDFKFMHLRELLYDICIFDFNIYNCMSYIQNQLILNDLLTPEKLNSNLIESYKFIKLYNNNYRPIYHLEKYILYIIAIVHELF